MVWPMVIQNQSPSCFTFLIFDHAGSNRIFITLASINDGDGGFLSALYI
jgi:hypothetical protein